MAAPPRSLRPPGPLAKGLVPTFRGEATRHHERGGVCLAPETALLMSNLTVLRGTPPEGSQPSGNISISGGKAQANIWPFVPGPSLLLPLPLPSFMPRLRLASGAQTWRNNSLIPHVCPAQGCLQNSFIAANLKPWWGWRAMFGYHPRLKMSKLMLRAEGTGGKGGE